MPASIGHLTDSRSIPRDRSVLDVEVIGRLTQLGTSIKEDLVGQLAVLFLADADVHVRDLRQALDAGDAVAVVGSAHSLRGASANLGARDLVGLCGSLEMDAADDDLSRCDALFDALQAELARVCIALVALSTTLRTSDATP